VSAFSSRQNLILRESRSPSTTPSTACQTTSSPIDYPAEALLGCLTTTTVMTFCHLPSIKTDAVRTSILDSVFATTRTSSATLNLTFIGCDAAFSQGLANGQRRGVQTTWDNWTPVTTILAALFDRGFFLITISTSRSSALRKCISRSTENPSNR
jgi:hypothetical protein